MHLRLTPLIALLLCCAAATPPTPQAREMAEANRLVAQLRNPSIAFEEKTKLAEELLSLGAEGPKRLAPLARSEFLNRRTAYATRFEKAAADALKARLKPAAVREVEQLRQQIQAIVKARDVSKESIVSTADPALKRLEELLSLTPEQVVESSADLAKQRVELLAWLDWAAAAVDKLPDADRKSMPGADEVKSLRPEFEESEALMALLSLAPSPEDRRVLLANLPLAKQLDPEEAEGIAYLNEVRLRVGLPALSIDPKLCAAARDHSKEMVEKRYFSHTSPTPGRETFAKRAQLAGARAAAENIYAGGTDGKGAIRAWWHSPGHLRNMMANHKRIGLGRHGGTWTQVFG